jgi:hypothetical protein
MNQLITKIREKYRTPGEVMRALALDENLLREESPPEMSKRDKAALAGLKTMLAEDASLGEITEFVRALSALETGGSAEGEEEEISEEFGNEDTESEDDAPGAIAEVNSGVPGAEGEGEEAASDEPAAQIHAMLKNKLSPEEMAQIGELLEKIAAPEDEGEESDEHDAEVTDKPEEENPEGEDEDEEDDMTTQDKDLVTRPAMDEAIKAAVASAEKRAKANAKEVRDAEHAVRPWVGELAMAFDSAEDVYRQALTMLKVPGAKTIHVSALPDVLKLIPRPGQQATPAREVSLGMDAAAAADFGKMFPNAGRITLAH